MIGRLRRTALGLLCLLLGATGAVSVTVPVHGAAQVAASDDVLRILLVGDSVTQGSSGDWTWRHRLWQHLQAAGVAVDFVGPRDDLWDLATDGPGATTYADPGFDRDHAARWGMWSGFPDTPIGTLVAAHQPDVIVTMLGVNDVLWGRSPDAVAADTTGLVAAAREVDPDLAFVVAEATQHWYAGVATFNDALPAVAAAVTTPTSPVVVATASAGYDEQQDTWDHSHANARGEVKIAAAVADALHLVGVGPPAVRPLALPPVGPRTGAVLSGAPGDGSATLSWQGPAGATSHRLWARDTTDATATPWAVVAEGLTPSGTHVVPALVNGRRHEYRLQPVKGDDEPEGEVFSNVVAVLPVGVPPPPPPPPPPPAPALAAPTRLHAAAGRRCVRLAWRPVAGATSYRVQRRSNGHWTRGVRTTVARTTLVRLPVQSRWRFRVRAVRGTTYGRAAVIDVRRRPLGRCS